MSSLPALESLRGQLRFQIDSLAANISTAQQNLTRLEARLALAPDSEKVAIQGNITTLRSQVARESAELASLTEQLAAVDAQIIELRSVTILPDQSTGQTVRDDQAARNSGASAGNPPVGPETDENGRIIPKRSPVDTNAERFSENTDIGTDAATRDRTQSIPPPTADPGGIPPNGGEFAYPNTFNSVSAPGDDAGGYNADVRSVLNATFGTAQQIVPQPNPLDKYASYTYNISLYIMGPEQYQRLLNTGDRNISGWQLLMQSGGAPQGTFTPGGQINPNIELPEIAAQSQVQNLGRSQFFPLDFYLDDLRLTSVVQGKGTTSAHNVVEMAFKIYEPNGFSLFQRLWLAAQQYNSMGPAGPISYQAQNYLMVIKWYGYDDAGNLVRPSVINKTGPNSDASAVIEKWVPFQFRNIKTRIANKITEYDCDCATPQDVIAGGQARGVIPYNVELTSTTIDQLLNGTSQFGATTAATNDTQRTLTAPAADARSRTTTGEGPTAAASTTQSAPPKADAAPKTLIKGLVDALNKYQQDLCQGTTPTYTYPDQYEIIIKDEVLKQAKVVPPGSPNKAGVPMTNAQTAGEAKLGAKQKVDNNSQNKSIVAGTTIIQLIDQIVRNSTYITEQQLYTVDPVTGEITKNGIPAETVGWFHIGMEVQPLKYDYRRNDYAYKIIYSVNLYAISESKSDWFPNSVFRGTHKQYNYWFTGLNTQVLNFTQELDNLYYLVISGPSFEPDRNDQGYTDYREYTRRNFQPRSGETDQGNRNKTFEPAANLADSLYSPSDTNIARMTIVGDPDWIQQGQSVFGVPDRPNYQPFLDDNSINFDAQEPLFEILWNQPVDYDMWTGLMDPGQTNFYANRPKGNAGQARVSNIYHCRYVFSTFSKGRFTQEIDGTQVYFHTKTTKENETRRTGTGPGTPTLSGTEYTNFRRSEIAEQNAGTPIIDAGKARTSKGRITNIDQIIYDEMGNPIYTPPVLPSAPAQSPTSGGRVVGSDAVLGLGTGGATGTNAGQPPSAQLVLNNGEVVEVTSQAQIQQYANRASPQARQTAEFDLTTAQQSANNPTTASRNQLVVKENG